MEGIKKLLTAQTAGLPNWAWLLIIAGGVVAAIIVPKFFGGGSTTATPSTDTTGTTPVDTSGLAGYTPYYGNGGGGGGGTTTPATTTTPDTTTTTDGTATPTIPVIPAPAPVLTPAQSQLATQNAMQAAAQQPPTTAPNGTPLSNLQKITNYLSGLGKGGTVQQYGTPGHPQSGYLVTSNQAFNFHVGPGWNVTKCGTNKYLVKGPGATNVHFGANCAVTGYS